MQGLTPFVVRVIMNGRDVHAYLPNTGRMSELLVSGTVVYVAPACGTTCANLGGPRHTRGHGSGVWRNWERKTAYDLILVRYGSALVSMDSRLPTVLFRDRTELGNLAGFGGYVVDRAEVPLGDSRIDMLLSGSERSCYVETKSVNLVVNGRALFPDAETERGRRHLEVQAVAVESGHRACAVFVVQRGDVVEMAPYREVDKHFAEALDQAAATGVEVRAYRCRVTLQEITIERSILVRLCVA